MLILGDRDFRNCAIRTVCGEENWNAHSVSW